ncbi:MAG: hypothetical protein IPL84_07620 [Chitinophagaceae bacterium]|nr:hypothetical protein [Chitinophagaceae bacterium]
MKHVSIYFKKIRQQKLLFVFLFVSLMMPFGLIAQTDSAASKEEVVAEEKEMISPSLDLIVVQKGDNSIDLKVAIQAKVDKVFHKLPLLKVSFLQVIGDEEKEIGSMITDRAGKAVFTCKPNAVVADNEGKINFKAVFAGNKSMDPADAAVTIKRARIELTPVKEDSVYTVQLKLVDVGSGKEIPVPETDLGVFVKRLFKPLKIGTATTDENGEASVEIASKLPGNAKGDITLIAKLDESELYGNLETSTVVNWGVPVSDVVQAAPRALWSAHPPIWMMVTFVVLMTVVWGHYIVIIFELFRLRKEEPHPKPELTNT